MELKKSRFIVFEGAAGSGKTSGIQRYMESNAKAKVINPPRWIFKEQGHTLTYKPEEKVKLNDVEQVRRANFFLDGMIEASKEIIDDGTLYIGDRWFYSTLVYQIYDLLKNPVSYLDEEEKNANNTLEVDNQIFPLFVRAFGILKRIKKREINELDFQNEIKREQCKRTIFWLHDPFLKKDDPSIQTSIIKTKNAHKKVFKILKDIADSPVYELAIKCAEMALPSDVLLLDVRCEEAIKRKGIQFDSERFDIFRNRFFLLGETYGKNLKVDFGNLCSV